MFTLPDTFIKKFDLLPQHRKQEVIDFLDFVFNRHLDSLDEVEEPTISDELRQFLIERLIHAKQNRDKSISSEDYDKKVKAKYCWK